MTFTSWVIRLGSIFWISLTPRRIPGKKRNKNSPLQISQKSFDPGNDQKAILGT